MEPINYRDALRRRWPVIPVVALVGAIVGALFPVHVPYPPPHNQFEASALVGVAPGSTTGPNSTGSHVSIPQMIFFAANQQVIVNAAKSVGIKGKPDALEAEITITAAKKKKKSVTPAGTVRIAVKQPTAKRSAKLTTAFIHSLTDFINQRLSAQHQNAIRSAQQKVSNLSDQLQNLETQLQALEPTPSTTTTTTTTTTTVPKTSTTVAAPPTAATASGTTTSDRRPGPVPAVLAASKTNPDISILQQQIAVLMAAYNAALTTLNNLRQSGAETSGIVTLQPALAKNAKKIPAKVSIFSHHSTRAFLGLAAGALFGLGAIFLLDALDKRLRTVARTQETLGYPVLAEIPQTTRARRRGRGRRGDQDELIRASPFAVFSEPTSIVAEAYRMLRTALLQQPIVGQEHSALAEPEHRPRDVILVVSAGAEPTRALVVTNLAAAFAEAGQKALIVTTADLRQQESARDTVTMPSVGSEMSPQTVAELSRPTEIPGVRSLALGRVLAGPGQLAPYAPGILQSARQVVDVVIVDAPLLAVHDAEALVPAVDIVLVVVQGWWTRVDQATRSGGYLRRISAPVVGAALTEVYIGKKDPRRAPERKRHTDAEDEDRMVSASRMARPRRRLGRRSRWVEAEISEAGP